MKMQEHNKNGDNIIARYQQLVDSAKIVPDEAQREVLRKLYKLQQDIEIKILQSNSSFLKKIFAAENNQPHSNGLYIYGDVGRGKSMLMDLFFETSSVIKKRRVHFHAFMLEVHKSLFKWRNQNKDNAEQDPIGPLAKKIASESTLLCFDEFQVNDIADAMILARLFTALFANDVIVVATSNRAPDELYMDGLQRERFLPFIKLLKQNVGVAKLNANQDYRLSHLKSLSTVYYSPIDRHAHSFMESAFKELTNNAPPQSRTMEINGRKLLIPKTSGNIAWMSFHDLCEQPLGAADYIEIAREFSTLLVSGIPSMGAESRNEAKRFVTLIDELYEHRVKLVCTADTSPELIYSVGDGSFEFERTVSRLIEMQSDKYLEQEHLS